MDLAMEIVGMASSALPAMEDMDSPASTEWIADFGSRKETSNVIGLIL
jgi:hypothetical protein